MIERYSRPEMLRVWSEENRLALFLRVEAACLEVMARDKGVSASELKAVKALSGKALVEEARKREASSRHEMIGLLAAAQDFLSKKAPKAARFLHYGLTSSDVLDTALALQLREAADLLIEGVKDSSARLRALARRHELTWMAGRTHGVHAEPITLGMKLAGWHAELLRCLERLERARSVISYGKISGAVGTFAHLTPRFEAQALAILGLRPEPVSTQIIPRDRHADFFHSLSLAAASIERFALEIRHLQRTEVLELEEPFGEGQKGSSAMPHKKNPVLCENLCGLARLVRSYEVAVMENVALWHERDISHSSVERVALPDACVVLDFMLARFSQVLEGLKVNADNMRRNLEASGGIMFSQRVLLKLVDFGLPRGEAYDLVQKCALAAQRTRSSLLSALEGDPAVTKRLGSIELKACFELDSYGRHAREILKRGGVL